MSDTFAQRLLDVEHRYRGHPMATIEQIITGPTRRSQVDWLVVLYRSSEVAGGRQLVGYPVLINELSYRQMTATQFDRTVTDIWLGAVDEPPGSDLPEDRLNPGGIAWWVRAEDWTAEKGPPDEGLPARRVHRHTQP